MFNFISAIAHRGNLNGPNPTYENNPSYLAEAIDECFGAEADIWYKDGGFYLGHDEPTYPAHYSWLHDHQHSLYLHCKNVEALQYLSKEFNCFWHQGDDYTLTSKLDIWTNIGKKPIKGGILVDLEYPTVAKKVEWLQYGSIKICSDWAKHFNF